ncbi:MAG: glycosyltransferase family 4 protein [Bdellovibrionota bacterium]|nr:glycosyltransferase family 4 protein [Bdellovibrionota bacterium]
MKLAVVKKQNQSSWRSCQSITSNLELAYEEFSQALTFSISDKATIPELDRLVKEIFENKITHLAWVDHYPHPGAFLEYLKNNFSDELQENPLKVVIHIFGDFILHSPQWFKHFSKWNGENLKIQLVAASHRQGRLVDQFLQEGGCEIIPFPVNKSEFSFDQKLRISKRKSLNVEEEEHLFFYSGRLSYQKNIFDIINGFCQFYKMTNSQCRLLIAGPMDDLGIPYIGKEALEGTFYFHWEECMNSLPEGIRNKITYLGNVTPLELKEYSCAADTYLSMSCHNDEDYGMAPAEALMCGLPCILSDWGGFSSFKHYLPNVVTTVPINLSQHRQAPDNLKVTKAMLLAQQHSDREGLSHEAQLYLGIEDVAKKLQELLESASFNFRGFNGKFIKLASLFRPESKGPFRSGTGEYSLFYQDIYKVYCDRMEEDDER